MASRRPGPAAVVPAQPWIAQSSRVLSLLRRLGPGAPLRPGCSPSPSALRVCRLWAPASFRNSASQIHGAPETEDLDPRTGEAAGGHYPTLRRKVKTFKPFCPLPDVRTPGEESGAVTTTRVRGMKPRKAAWGKKKDV